MNELHCDIGKLNTWKLYRYCYAPVLVTVGKPIPNSQCCSLDGESSTCTFAVRCDATKKARGGNSIPILNAYLQDNLYSTVRQSQMNTDTDSMHP